MATTTEGGIDQQLLNELRKRYPEVPEYVVTGQMIKVSYLLSLTFNI